MIVDGHIKTLALGFFSFLAVTVVFLVGKESSMVTLSTLGGAASSEIIVGIRISSSDIENASDIDNASLRNSSSYETGSTSSSSSSSSSSVGSSNYIDGRTYSTNRGTARDSLLSNTDGNVKLLERVSDATWPRLRNVEGVDPKDPRLDFIKLSKVGGTSIAVALNNIAKRYGIRTGTKCRSNLTNDTDAPPLRFFTIIIRLRPQKNVLREAPAIWSPSSVSPRRCIFRIKLGVSIVIFSFHLTRKSLVYRMQMQIVAIIAFKRLLANGNSPCKSFGR